MTNRVCNTTVRSSGTAPLAAVVEGAGGGRAVRRTVAHRAAETPEKSQARRRQHAEYLASQRADETPESPKISVDGMLSI
ncbi:hypothetical protein EVAR_12810_1 [Eumeta japonica]|uniref:Uncharacterized protein n=1 Tax=Eumeta variegata TaxID=151549 RepID=A0A4C1UB28_EUMVA|nr:hypothetical protein EVAR_12810_1 [Eumeta japonica]